MPLRDRLAQRRVEQAGQGRDRRHRLGAERLHFRRHAGIGHRLHDDVACAGGLKLAGGRREVDRRLRHRRLHLRRRDLPLHEQRELVKDVVAAALDLIERVGVEWTLAQQHVHLRRDGEIGEAWRNAALGAVHQRAGLCVVGATRGRSGRRQPEVPGHVLGGCEPRVGRVARAGILTAVAQAVAEDVGSREQLCGDVAGCGKPQRDGGGKQVAFEGPHELGSPRWECRTTSTGREQRSQILVQIRP